MRPPGIDPVTLALIEARMETSENLLRSMRFALQNLEAAAKADDEGRQQIALREIEDSSSRLSGVADRIRKVVAEELDESRI